MTSARSPAPPPLPPLPTRPAGLRTGIDLVAVPRIAESLERLGERFVQRLFTAQEAADCRAVAGHAARCERLAARFAAKEAVIKAMGWAEAGVSWRDIEVVRAPDGRQALALHGRAAALAAGAGVRHWALSLGHTAGQACALVIASGSSPDTPARLA
ncbi:holo-ACP synthase [Ideonella sp.]|uniref:holo-ACP synthase n=1 Tax=Ideonella sp. TaxID=1929293 RepID=UPI0035B39D51